MLGGLRLRIEFLVEYSIHVFESVDALFSFSSRDGRISCHILVLLLFKSSPLQDLLDSVLVLLAEYTFFIVIMVLALDLLLLLMHLLISYLFELERPPLVLDYFILLLRRQILKRRST